MVDTFDISLEIEAQSKPFACRENQDVLSAMKQVGLACIPTGCRGGGCGVCRVDILEGQAVYGKMSRSHITQNQEDLQSAALACKLYPSSHMRLRPSGTLFKKINQNAQKRSVHLPEKA